MFGWVTKCTSRKQWEAYILSGCKIYWRILLSWQWHSMGRGVQGDWPRCQILRGCNPVPPWQAPSLRLCGWAPAFQRHRKARPSGTGPSGLGQLLLLPMTGEWTAMRLPPPGGTPAGQSPNWSWPMLVLPWSLPLWHVFLGEAHIQQQVDMGLLSMLEGLQHVSTVHLKKGVCPSNRLQLCKVWIALHYMD